MTAHRHPDVTVHEEEAKRVLGVSAIHEVSQEFAKELLAAEKRIKDLEEQLAETRVQLGQARSALRRSASTVD